MKLTLYLVLLLLVIPFANASLSVTSPLHTTYNLGDSLEFEAKIIEGYNLNGFFKAKIKCPNLENVYFSTPLSIIANKEKSVDIPKLIFIESMIGSCTIDFIIESNDNSLIEQTTSPVFEITNLLSLNTKLNKLELYPEDELQISGDSKNARGEKTKTAKIYILIDNITYEDNLKSGTFSFSLDLGKNIKSYEHNTEIRIEDGYGNKGSNSFSFKITPIPTELKNSLNNIEFKPEETAEIESLLYDQAGDLLKSTSKLIVINPEGDEVLNQQIETETQASLVLPKYALPGQWIIQTEASGLKIKTYFKVLEIKNIDVKLDSSTLIITNTGNINYKDSLEIDVGDIPIIKKLGLIPGEEVTLNLADEKNIISSATYNIKILSGIHEFNFENIQIDPNPKTFVDKYTPFTGHRVLGSVSGLSKDIVIYSLIPLGLILLYTIIKRFLKGSSSISNEEEIKNLSSFNKSRPPFKNKELEYKGDIQKFREDVRKKIQEEDQLEKKKLFKNNYESLPEPNKTLISSRKEYYPAELVNNEVMDKITYKTRPNKNAMPSPPQPPQGPTNPSWPFENSEEKKGGIFGMFN